MEGMVANGDITIVSSKAWMKPLPIKKEKGEPKPSVKKMDAKKEEIKSKLSSSAKETAEKLKIEPISSKRDGMFSTAGT